MERIPIPVIDGKYITVYRPKGDIYRGKTTRYFQPNTFYASWTVNDFSIINDNGNWHIVGITHPTPPHLPTNTALFPPCTMQSICSFTRPHPAAHCPTC